MQADVILESPNRRIIMDAKFYRQALSTRFETSKLRSAHLYQLLAYLRNREATAEPGPQHEGILLYPTVDENIRVAVRLEGFPVSARSLRRGFRKAAKRRSAYGNQPTCRCSRTDRA